jgi:uncharacterized protein
MFKGSELTANLPELGVGIIYCSALEPLIERDPGLIDVIEIEPQTLWTQDAGMDSDGAGEEVVAHLLTLPGHKLVHNVGTPAGGTVRPAAPEMEVLRHWIERLGSPWWSDHLSFNRTPEFSTGFFLPPLQTTGGVEALASGIRALRSAVPLPLALETGVNYLHRRPGELPDGEFVARTVEAADCGLLLDLHNVFTNARNGRQAVEEYLAQIPLERVWEMHLAGGVWHEGYWLDAHSGPIPDELFRIAEQLVPMLPNLRAIIFEIYPTFVPLVGLDVIKDEIHRLRSLWESRGANRVESKPLRRSQEVAPSVAMSAQAWERALGRLATGQTAENDLQRELARDPSIALVRNLIHEFRASMISRALPLTMRLLMLMITPAILRKLLKDFESKCLPQMYAGREAQAFAEYIDEIGLQIPRLRDILSFELAVIATLKDGATRIVPFDFEPMPLLRAIAAGRLPSGSPTIGQFEIEITGDNVENFH